MLFLSDDGFRLGVFETDEQRFVAEGRIQGLGDRSDLEDAQDAEIQLGDLVHEQADPVLRLQAESAEERPDRVRGPADVMEGVAFLVPAHALPNEGRFIPLTLEADAVGAMPTDIEDAAGPVLELLFSLFPCESLAALFVIPYVRHVHPFNRGLAESKL